MSDTSMLAGQQARGLARLNPAPQQHYQVRLRLLDAPGAFADIRASAQYDVANEAQCGHINPASGTAERITSHEPVALRADGQGGWQGEVALDAMLDEDYYGRGICHWQLAEVRVVLRATGADGETRFVLALPADQLQAGGTARRWYWNGGYPRAEADDYPDTGMDSAEGYRAELRDALFAIELSAAGA